LLVCRSRSYASSVAKKNVDAIARILSYFAQQAARSPFLFYFGDRKALRLAKLSKEPEQFTFKLLGLEVSGIGWFPSRCAVVLSYIAMLVLLAHIVGAAVGWWSIGISLPKLSEIAKVAQG